MHRVFQNFIDLLSSAEDPARFSEAISVAAAALDLSCFAYLALPRKQNDKPRLISTAVLPCHGRTPMCGPNATPASSRRHCFQQNNAAEARI